MMVLRRDVGTISSTYELELESSPDQNTPCTSTSVSSSGTLDVTAYVN